MPCECLRVEDCRFAFFPLGTPQRVFSLFGRDGVRPRRLESESAGSFLGGAFRGRFNYRAQRIAEETGIFPVGVVNAPELIAWTRSCGRCHGRSSSQSEFVKMYQLHKMHGQSGFRSEHVLAKAQP